MIRIAAGQFKGQSLVSPPQIRPTSAQVRQAIFNILADVVPGSRVLDGFAGSGSLGFEAFSRGAAYVAFVDNDTASILAIRDNLAKLSHELSRSSWRVMQTDIEDGLRELARREPPFDVILLDPPYRSDGAKKALNAVVGYAMLAPAGIVAVEHDRKTLLPQAVGPLCQQKQHRYGETVLSFYRQPSQKP